MCFRAIPEIELEPGITLESEDGVTIIDGECNVTMIRAITVNDGAQDVTCEQVITFEVDYERPQIFCPSDLMLPCGQPVPPPNPGNLSGDDNCTAPGDLVFAHVEDVVSGTDVK